MKLLLTYSLIGIATCINAQTLDKTMISSGGESLSNADIQVNLTIGEPLVGIIENELSLDQGFWAGGLRVEPMLEEEELGGIIIYPNPVEDQLNIFTNNNAVFGITLFSVDGRMAMKKQVDSSLLEHNINLSFLAKGVYVLRLFVEDDKQEKLFKIIKK